MRSVAAVIATAIVTCCLNATAGETQHVEIGHTSIETDGNRWISGAGRIDRQGATDIALRGIPQWVVGVPVGEASLWVVTLEGGVVQAFRRGAGGVREVEGFHRGRLRGPPLLVVRAGKARLVEAPADASPLTHPQPLGPDGRLAYLNESGAVVVREGAVVLGSLDVDALPDARLLADGAGRVLLLTRPTLRYGHGVLGDAVEAGAFTLVDTREPVSEIRTVEVARPAVIEGIAPIWVDWNGDGQREVVVTESDDANGARVVLYAESGERLASGPAIGLGHRWRHTIAVAPFGPAGERELAEVLTPHIGGVAGFYRWRGSKLERVAKVGGVTSHVYGSRNLDMALAGDFDSDGRAELLLPSQNRRRLRAVRRVGESASVAWEIDAGGTVVTNLGALTTHDARIAVAVGTKQGRLRVWGP